MQIDGAGNRPNDPTAPAEDHGNGHIQYPYDRDWIVKEHERCALDFWYWATRYAQCRDAATNLWVPYIALPAQRELINMILRGEWPIGLKVRRLGYTTAVMMTIVWLLQLHAGHRALVVSARVDKARDLVAWFQEVSKRLPDWMRQNELKANMDRVELDNTSIIRAEAGTESAGRMLGLDILFIDEARYVEYLRQTLTAAEPALQTSRGVSCVVSTGSPGTYYEGLWRASDRGATSYKPIFFGWRARPDMTQAIYDRERAAHKHNLSAWLNEMPDNPEEAFMSSSGRVFPRFSIDHVRHLERPLDARLYRAFDFGYSPNHQWVCIWLWHDEYASPGFSWEPDCDTVLASPELMDSYAHGVKQMFAFHRKPSPPHDVEKKNDDIPDALAYAFAQFDFVGHVHVYRTFSAHSGETRYEIDECVTEVMKLSGWQLVPGETNRYLPSPNREVYAGNVADRAAVGAYGFMNKICGAHARDLMAVPYKDIKGGGSQGQKEARFGVVNAFIAGARDPYDMKVVGGRERHQPSGETGNPADPRPWSGQTLVASLNRPNDKAPLA